MKFAIDCRMIGSGGIGTYFESVLPYLLKNYECLLFGKDKDIEKYKNFGNAELKRCEIDTFSVNELIHFPKDLLKEINKCDIYYTPYCNIPNGIKIPIYSTIHDVVFLDIKGLSSTIGTFIRKIFYKRAISKSEVVFTVSKFSAERIKHHLKTKKDIVVTYNSVPEWFINKGNEKKENVILFVGNIKRHKGLHILVTAFNKVVSQGLKAQLLIVGNADNFRSQDSSIFEEIDKNENIKFTGRISDEELKNLYASSSLLVQPSLYEGFGMPPLEALTMGTNVIISDIPVFKEIYKEFPVTYFESENPNDLANKIIENFNKEAPKNLPEIYSFKKTSDIIINTILEKEK